jgi:hypothetical protein
LKKREREGFCAFVYMIEKARRETSTGEMAREMAGQAGFY